MTDKKTIEVEFFKRGTPLPDWLFTLTPVAPDAEIITAEFTQDVMLVPIAENRLYVLGLEHTGRTININVKNVNMAPTGPTIVVPSGPGQVFPGPADDLLFTRGLAVQWPLR